MLVFISAQLGLMPAASLEVICNVCKNETCPTQPFRPFSLLECNPRPQFHAQLGLRMMCHSGSPAHGSCYACATHGTCQAVILKTACFNCWINDTTLLFLLLAFLPLRLPTQLISTDQLFSNCSAKLDVERRSLMVVRQLRIASTTALCRLMPCLSIRP